MTSETVIMGQKMASQAAAGVVTTEKAILEKSPLTLSSIFLQTNLI